jgi:hypothetical protein
VRIRIALAIVSLTLLSACHSASSSDQAGPTLVDPAAVAASGDPSASVGPAASTAASASASASASPSATPSKSSPPKSTYLPKPGNGSGHASVPSAARAADTSHPDRTVGTGTPASCTSAAVVKAVAAGGVIVFDCGPAPVTITMTATAKVKNANSPVVLDGGNKVTLSGGNKRRILYVNACDQAQGWTTSHCNDQETPKVTVQNIAFTKGNSTGDTTEGGGGGAIFARGGHLKVVNSRFTGNRCDSTGPDLGGAAIRVLDQGSDAPVYVVGSTFTGGVCSNGSALSSIGVSWTVLNSVFSGNSAIGNGANPARGGTPGGGSGGAIYLDGDKFQLILDGTLIEKNHAKEGGGAVFFVSNDRTGTLTIRNSTLRSNPSDGFETFKGVFYLGSGDPKISGSKIS